MLIFLPSSGQDKNTSLKYYFAIIISILSNSTLSSDYGTTGLIDTPTARMSLDGNLTATSAWQSRTSSYSLTYQATPWLEGTFRYTGFNDFFHWDRNYEVKAMLIKENNFFPQVAIGIRDIVGTGIFGSEYVVASKQIRNFDLSFGMGWGRLAGDGIISNPMKIVSSRFATRTVTSSGDQSGSTGKFQLGQFFSGPKAGLFGGLSYDFPNMPLSIMLEYNPDKLEWSTERGAPSPKSPINSAITWRPSNALNLTLSYQNNQDWGLLISSKLDSKSLPKRASAPFFISSLKLSQSDLPEGINKSQWYDTLLYDVERSGILLIEATLNEQNYTATMVMGNSIYPIWTDAVSVMVKLADIHLPNSIHTFRIIIEEEGHRVNTLMIRRPSFQYDYSGQLKEQNIRIRPPFQMDFVQHRTEFARNKFMFNVNLANRVQLFDPDDPARYQIYAKIGLEMALPSSWVLSGSYGYDIKNNFDESTRKSNSILQHVRSDVVEYLTQGDSGIDSLYLSKRGSLSDQVHYRVFGGILEYMYSGIGGEILYQPFRSRIALGISANIVRQRDYDKSFKHLDYQTWTSLASMYWASPFYNFDFGIHLGRYLAKDLGATFEIRRTFANGWMVGLWATKTNVSSEDFGEGSFDKGLFFKIPFGSIFGNTTRTSYTTRIRPVQRDGGQYLEDFNASIWWGTRSARYDALQSSMGRVY